MNIKKLNEEIRKLNEGFISAYENELIERIVKKHGYEPYESAQAVYELMPEIGRQLIGETVSGIIQEYLEKQWFENNPDMDEIPEDEWRKIERQSEVAFN